MVGSSKAPAPAIGPAGADLPAVAATFGKAIAAWPDYVVDAFQRSVLFLDLLRQRGNEEIEITSRPMATVLSFDHEVLMSGRSLPKPINYSLSRIVPPPGVAIDPHKRPVVVVDPRAGQGPGIGGFKAESEIGDALGAGHPGLFHRLWRDARTRPAVPRCRRGTGEVLRAGGRTPSRTRRDRLPSATVRRVTRR